MHVGELQTMVIQHAPESRPPPKSRPPTGWAKSKARWRGEDCSEALRRQLAAGVPVDTVPRPMGLGTTSSPPLAGAASGRSAPSSSTTGSIALGALAVRERRATQRLCFRAGRVSRPRTAGVQDSARPAIAGATGVGAGRGNSYDPYPTILPCARCSAPLKAPPCPYGALLPGALIVIFA